MLENDFAKLLKQLPAEWEAPEGFFENIFLRDDCYCFLLNCSGDKAYFHVGTPCEEITGFYPTDFAKGGIEFWLSRVHPSDISYVTEAIIEGFSQLAGIRGSSGSPVMIRMRYRFLTAGGDWLNTLDTRYLFSLKEDGLVDKLLCKMELLDHPADEINTLKKITDKHPDRNLTLTAAIRLKSHENKSANPQADHPALTTREKQILALIGEGLSTKMIADQCYISVHTVETHRKHLLEKLDVRNSMELIKKASKYFWI